MSSINKDVLFSKESLDDPFLNNTNTKKTLLLKYSDAAPEVNNDDNNAEEKLIEQEPRKIIITKEEKQLWFDDVSPTGSNEMISDDENKVLDQKPDSLLTNIIETILWPINFVSRKFSKGSIKGSVFTLMTATLGAGILSLPQAVLYSGLYFSILQLLVCAYLGYFTTMLLVQCADLSKNYSYMTLASATYGKNFTLFVKWVFFFSNWGFTVAFIVLSNKLIVSVLRTVFGLNYDSEDSKFFLIDYNSKFWPCIVMTIYGFPASLFRTLGALRYTFLLGIFFVSFLTISVIIESTNIGNLSFNYFEKAKYFQISGFLTTFPIAIFSFTCHSNVLDVYQELQRKSRRRMSKVLSRVMIIACLLYVLVGIFGYLTLADRTTELTGDDYGGVILLAPSYGDKIPMNISLCLICISIIFTFPLNIKPTKDSLLDILYPEEKNESNTKHFILVFIVSATALGAALVIPSVSDVLTILGATTTPFLCFFFPCMYYFKYANYRKDSWKRKIKRIFAGFLIGLTFVLMIFGLIYFGLKKAGKVD